VPTAIIPRVKKLHEVLETQMFMQQQLKVKDLLQAEI
jgi:hypothetical protein